MISQEYAKTKSIAVRFAPGTTQADLYQPSQEQILDPYSQNPLQIIKFSGYVESLRAKIKIRSTPEIAIPALDIGQSQTDRLIAVRDMEWTSQRKELEIRLQVGNGPVLEIARVSCLNRLPYYSVDLLPFLTADVAAGLSWDAKLSARIVDAGWGLLEGEDEVVIFGSAKEEAIALPQPLEGTSSVPYSWTVGGQPQDILLANPSRTQVTLINTDSTDPVYLAFNATADAGKGITLLPNGGSYEINNSNPFRGRISAVSTGTATLTGLEVTANASL